MSEPTPRPSPELEELQVKIAFLERTLEELNEVVLEQGRSLETLQGKIALLESRAAAAAEGATEERDLLDERPPHY
jgi:SlyX protein